MALIQKISKNKLQKGYTVLEVMIVLSVSTLIFTAAIAGYARQNSKTQFTNGVRDIENKIQDTLNDVSTGFYPQATDFDCSRSGSPAFPRIDPAGTSEQGTNQDCIFLGKAVDINDGSMNSYTIVGLRNSKDDEDVLPANVEDAENRIIPSTVEGTFSSFDLNASVHISRIVDNTGADSAGFSVVSGFGHGNMGGAGATTNQVSIASIDPSFNFASSANRVVNNAQLGRSVTICIEETGGGRQASITIGSGAQTNIQTMIDGWAPECS